jgi:hypothetical protein
MAAARMSGGGVGMLLTYPVKDLCVTFPGQRSTSIHGDVQRVGLEQGQHGFQKVNLQHRLAARLLTRKLFPLPGKGRKLWGSAAIIPIDE